MRVTPPLVLLAVGCGNAAGTTAPAPEGIAESQAAIQAEPEAVACTPDATYCEGNEIHQCSKRGTRGPAIYDCAMDPNAKSNNPVVCSTDPGYANVNFVDWPTAGYSPTAGCSYKHPTCKREFKDHPEFSGSTYGNEDSTPECYFDYAGTSFVGSIQLWPTPPSQDKFYLRFGNGIDLLTADTTYPIETAVDDNATDLRVNGISCCGEGSGRRTLTGTATVHRLPPDFEVSVDLTCSCDPTMVIKGRFSGRYPSK